MKILVAVALLVAATLSHPGPEDDPKQAQWPWQVGKQYRYDVQSFTLARLHEGDSTGSVFRTHFIVRVKAPGKLQARLENPEHAQVHRSLNHYEELPGDLKYTPVQNLDKPFEISLEGGRVLSMSLPAGLPLSHENLLKGLIGALQADLSTHRNVHSQRDTYDRQIQQGLFRKMETDVTGDCETQYSVSPVASEWRRELPQFADNEDPIEISKSKNYGHCHHRVDYHFGVPEGAEWSGTAHNTREKQFIKRATVSRMLVGKQGPIYKADTQTTVYVHPHVFGKQQAEVHSKVSLRLVKYEQDNEGEWEQPEGYRQIQNLLYSMTQKQVTIDENSSSSSSSESHERVHSRAEPEPSNPRFRRAARPKSVVAISKVIIKKRSSESSSSSSSSSSDSSSAYVNDDIPRSNEPAYAALYMNPQPHGDKKQNPMNAQKLVQEIAQLLQNPNNMPKADFLSKFNILVHVIASMSYGQLSQTSRSIEIAKSSNDIVKSDMWMIYRDAVTQAGTSPAFQQIKTWIQIKKIQGIEAAEVVAGLVHSLRYPTKDAMSQFFKLAMSPEVTEQNYLNTTALISATKFINMGQVNNYTAHSYYPTHMYGRLSQKYDRFVLDEVLPALKQELDKAIQQGDSHKAQIYVKAIGNLGHREILQVYAPYLEGKIPVSTYLRTRMVDSLEVLSYERDRYARAALYSIVQNTAEPYEVRVAAINTIFMGHITGAMMQEMAEMTHYDPSTEVRAALKYAIETAAQLRDPRYFDLSRSAEAVRPMLTRQQFGQQQSGKLFREYYNKNAESTYFSVLSKIGSQDSLFPKSYNYVWKDDISGWYGRNSIRTSFSNLQRFVELYKNLIYPKDTPQFESNHKYSADKISEILKIQRQPDQFTEGSLEMKFMNQERLYAFTDGDFKHFVESWEQYLPELEKNANRHYTKVVNRAQVSVMFPIAAGVPFIYKYKEPTLVHAQAVGKVGIDASKRNYDVDMDQEVKFTYAQNYDGSVGFLDTLSNNYASAGVISKIQLYVPIKIRLQTKSGEVKVALQPLDSEQDTTIAHYSVWPFTANQKKDTLVTISHDPNTKLVSRERKVISVDSKFGQQIGAQFQVQGYSYSSDYRDIGKLVLAADPLTDEKNFFNQRDLAQTHFNFRYLGKQSKNKGYTFTAGYYTYYNQKQEGKMSPTASEVSDVSPNSAARREELAQRVAAGIDNPAVTILDLSATIDMPQKLEYVVTNAVAQSPVDPKIQYAIFAGKNSEQHGNGQFNAVGTVYKPGASTLNFPEALQKDLRMPFEFDIRYGQNKQNIRVQGSAERTKKYTEQLRNHPMAKLCENEVARGNQYQSACYQMLVLAHAHDNFKASVTYNTDMSPVVKNAIYQVFRKLDYANQWNTEIDLQKVSPANKFEMSADMFYLDDTMNWVFSSRHGEMRIKNMPMIKAAAGVLSTYWPFRPHERVFNYYTSQQYQPFCSVDGSQIRTFSNRSYDYTLTRSWHVVMQQDKQEDKRGDDLVILARRPSENTQEVYISYRSENGKHLEIEIQPSQDDSNKANVNVKTNAKKVSDKPLTIYWDEDAQSPILEYHHHVDGVLMLNIRDDRLRVLYDGKRLVVLPSGRRNNNRGICGAMSGERRDDYQTPYGLVDRADHFAASYALNDEYSEQQTENLQNEAKSKAYKRETKYTAILRSDQEWNQAMESSSSSSEENWGSQNIYRSRSYSKQQKGPCELQQQVQYYENHGEICITTAPLDACPSYCKGDSYKMQAAQVVCRPKLDRQFWAYKDQIHKGQNPEVSGVPQTRQYKVPSSCKQ